MKMLFGFVILLGATASVFAQPNPDTLWTRTYGGSYWDYAHSVQQTADGGYIVAGWTQSFGAGGSDFYLVKTNSSGDTLWTRTHGGSSEDQAYSIQQTTDGGYVVAGQTGSFGAGDQDFYVVKTDAAGNPQWTRTYGGSSLDRARSIQQTTDGGYVVAGQTESFGAGMRDCYVVKTDAAGNPQWTRTYGGSSYEEALSIQQTTDGGYVIAGLTGSFGAGGYDFYVVKTDGQGDTLWTRTYGGSVYDYAYSVRQTADGGYIVAGQIRSFVTGDIDFYLVKTNSQGDTLWTRTFGGNSSDEARSVQQTADGGYIVAGGTYSFGAGGGDFYVVKTGPDPLFHALRVVSPNGGGQWTLWDSSDVQWVGTGFDGNVMIEINRDYPGGEWDTLAYDTPNDSVEPVFVDEPLSVHCRVRVSAVEDTFSDISDADFSIVTSQGYLALVRPAQPGTTVLSWNAGTMECPNAVMETFRLKNFGGASIIVYRPDEPASDVFSRVSGCPTSFTLTAGQMSTCDVALSFTPEADGTYRDSMRIRTNASNGSGGALWIPLTGTQVTTPSVPQVVITTPGSDARLSWFPISESIGGCPISVTHYLVFYSPMFAGPYYYHGYTADTTYMHLGVVRYASGQFYNVTATTAPLPLLARIPRDTPREEVEALLREEE